MLNKRWITLFVVYCRPFASKAVFRAIKGILSSPFTVRNNRRTILVLKGLQRRSDFPPENRIAPLSNFAAKRSKDSNFFSYPPIENPSKRPGASPRRKLKWSKCSLSIRRFWGKRGNMEAKKGESWGRETRPDRKVRFILGELLETWRWQRNDRKWFLLDGIESCLVGVKGSSKSICVRHFSPSALSLFRFHLFPFSPRKAWYSG